MLEYGPYPEHLKARVGGPLGHLSNAQAAELLSDLDCGGLQHVVAAHLSEKNNTPALARAALAQALNCELQWIRVASQDGGLGWCELLNSFDRLNRPRHRPRIPAGRFRAWWA